MPAILADSGPLVAYLDRRDAHHAWACEQMQRLAPPFLTCEAVLSEVAFLLRRAHSGADPALAFVRRGALQLPFRLEPEIDAITRLMTRYAKVPMSLADACLVRMSELETDPVVFTLDRDFMFYRRHRNRTIKTISPW